MHTVGMSAAEQDAVIGLVAAVLMIGNISFRENNKGQGQVHDQNTLAAAANMLRVDPRLLATCLTCRRIQTGGSGAKSGRGSTYNVPQNAEQVSFRVFACLINFRQPVPRMLLHEKFTADCSIGLYRKSILHCRNTKSHSAV